MKTLLTLVLVFFSVKSIAHTCHISLYDPYNRPYLNFYSQQDQNCTAAADRCYQSIRDYRLNPQYYKCYTISMVNDPQVASQPLPTREPLATNTIPSTDQDYRRPIEMGESVFHQGVYGVVTFISDEGLYEFLPAGKKKKDIVENVDRNALAVTRGCLRNICTKTSVISKSTQKFMSVEGIDYLGRYILQDVETKEYSFNIEFYNLVRTEGCLETVYGEKICTGAMVLGRGNIYYEVVGIQSENLVVLKDENGKLLFNVNPGSLVITR